MAAAYKFCASSGFVQLGSVDVQLFAGRAYVADDPVVRQYPHLFTDDPVVYTHAGHIVEAATAAPGERRGVRRG